MKLFTRIKRIGLVFTALIMVFASSSKADELGHPRLVVTSADIVDMKAAIAKPGLFSDTFKSVKASVDQQIQEEIVVPFPADGGGGYTHEKHKQNQRIMHDAGLMYQLTGEEKYANYVRDMLFVYADMYPKLGTHPMAKSAAYGQMFWQSLNEAVWLVYTIQAYDFILSSLSDEEQARIKTGLFDNIVDFIADQSPHTFDRIHNHGTWATAAVGMAGFVLDEPEWVEKSLLGLDKSGKGGYLRQLNELFSPDGYYNEGPYYQRYAMMPFILFAKSIEVNQPERKIFEARDNILLRAIDTTLQQSYNGLFFPFNDAIKSKGIDTIEMVYGASIVYGLTGDTGLLSVAKRQGQILLTGDGLRVAEALDAGKETPYPFRSVAYGDGAKGEDGALVVMRDGDDQTGSAIVFKATSQGLGHGHYDKLNWQFYDNGNEVIIDYGAARFLNVVSKFGGRYLPENNSYAKQSVAHNTLVVDETTHFDFDLDVGNANFPEVLFFEDQGDVKASAATIDTAYDDVVFTRTQALIRVSASEHPLVIDVMSVESDKAHTYDMPTHYNGLLIDNNFKKHSQKKMSALGKSDGYQHLWLKSKGKPDAGVMDLTWLLGNRFYSQYTLTEGNIEVLFTQLGANDPDFNLRPQNAFILRTKKAKNFDFVSLLETHGDYNPSKEYTKESDGRVSNLSHQEKDGVHAVGITFKDGSEYVFAYSLDTAQKMEEKSFMYNGKELNFSEQFKLFEL